LVVVAVWPSFPDEVQSLSRSVPQIDLECSVKSSVKTYKSFRADMTEKGKVRHTSMFIRIPKPLLPDHRNPRLFFGIKLLGVPHLFGFRRSIAIADDVLVARAEEMRDSDRSLEILLILSSLR
jgi:hypothetical protein